MCLSPGIIRMVGDSTDTPFLLWNDPVLCRVAKAPSMNKIHWVKWNMVCSHTLSKIRTLVVGEKSSQPGYYRDMSTVEIVLSATQTHRAPAHWTPKPCIRIIHLTESLPSFPEKPLYWWKNLIEKSVQFYTSKRLFSQLFIGQANLIRQFFQAHTSPRGLKTIALKTDYPANAVTFFIAL